ncbi:MAG: hypothetical protein ACYDEX_08220, partial [Mobilitalea sp.]
MGKIMNIESISQINEMIGNEKLKHPLITLIEPSKVKMIPVIDQKITMSLYSISLKNGDECQIKYGRQNYDFQEGTLMCLEPGQTIEPFRASDNTNLEGWALIFHPDLISKSALGKKMNEYTFFGYDSHEGL